MYGEQTKSQFPSGPLGDWEMNGREEVSKEWTLKGQERDSEKSVIAFFSSCHVHLGSSFIFIFCTLKRLFKNERPLKKRFRWVCFFILNRFWRNLALHYLLTSAVNGCCQNGSSNITIIHNMTSSKACFAKSCVCRKQIHQDYFNLIINLFLITTFHFWIIVIISCLNSYYDGTHSLQRIHWWASDSNFFKSVLI